MNFLKKNNKIMLLLGLILSSPIALAESVVSTEASSQSISTPIYEQLGVSSTTLFIIMTLFTLLLVGLMMGMAGSTKDIIKYKQDQKKADNKLKNLLVILGLFGASSAMAAGEAGQSTSLIPFPDAVFWAYIVVDIVLIMVIIYFAGIVKGTIVDMVKLPKSLLDRLFRWKKIKKSLTDAVPVQEEASILLDHEYDGITELDNNLPPWWKYGFYITIVWAVGYLLYFQVFKIGDLQEEEYIAQMEAAELEVAAYKEAHPELITVDNVELLTDPADIAEGRSIFNQYCVSCHMDGGAGGVGPNLTDEYWLYGNDIKGVFLTVSEGADNGMAAWKNLLPADQIQAVSSYVLQLDYLAPPQGKEPQGDKK